VDSGQGILHQARLKEELRALLNRYVEDAEASDGETLRSRTVGFFDPSALSVVLFDVV